MQKNLLASFLGILFITTLAGCSSAMTPATVAPTPPGEPTIVFANGTCVYTGPAEFPYGELKYNWSVEETDNTQFGVVSFSLAAGKTLDDFRAWDKKAETTPPEWVITLAYDGMHAAGGGSKFSKDLTSNGKYKGEPVYMACYRTDKAGNINILGPFTYTGKSE
jgi:hypothetical protein